MNISKISFGSNIPKVEIINREDLSAEETLDVPSPAKGKPVDTDKTQIFRTTPKRDEFRKSKVSDKTQRYDISNKKSKAANPKPPFYSLKRPFNSFVAGIAATLAATNIMAYVNKPDSSVVLPVDSSANISEIAAMYDTDPNAICLYNHIYDVSDISDHDEITVPTMFSNIDSEIEAIQQKLFNSNLTADERSKLEIRVKYLIKLQRLQDALATVYTDGKYAYYTINPLGDDVSPSIREKYQYGIPVDDFRLIFGIKDDNLNGASLIRTLGLSSSDSYMNFSGNKLTTGNTIKIKLGSIKDGSEMDASVIFR